MPKPKPTLEEVATKFRIAHQEAETHEAEKKKLRKLFFDLIDIPESELAQQTIFYEGENPERHVAVFYPKWRIVTKALLDEFPAEWKIIIQEDPEKRNFLYVTEDGWTLQRTVAESAPQVDLERLAQENPHLWQNITVQPPPPPRELKPLEDLTEDQKRELREFLTEPALKPTMQKPRKANPDELESR
jgi:hypothetical protein